MPLRVDIRPDTGTLWITGTVKPAGAVTGRRIRQRAGSDSPAAAREEAAAIEARILRDFHLGEKPSTHSFLEACQSYLTHQERSAGTKDVVRRLALHWRAAPLGGITQEVVDAARTKILRPGAADSTWRKTVGILSAIMNHAAKRKWCEPPSFDLPPEGGGRTRFLLPDEYERLHDGAPKHLKPLLTYLICTGSRLGEALSLDWSQVDLSASRVNVWADQTKGQKRRVVELTPNAVRALAGLDHRKGRVFLTPRGEPYPSSEDGGGQIRAAWANACRDAGLPGRTVEYRRGDRGPVTRPFKVARVRSGEITLRFIPEHGPHDLRHTWASWWYALTPDPFRLQQTGGWSSVELVARYAHLMPAGQERAIRRVWGIGKAAARVA